MTRVLKRMIRVALTRRRPSLHRAAQQSAQQVIVPTTVTATLPSTSSCVAQPLSTCTTAVPVHPGECWAGCGV